MTSLPLDNVTLSVTLLIGMMGMVWRLSSVIAKFNASNDELRRDLADIQRRTNELDKLPVLVRDVEQLKETYGKKASLIPPLRAEVEVLKERVESLRQPRLPSKSWTNEGEDR